MLPTAYNVETIGRIDMVSADGVTDQIYLKEAESIEALQERAKNLYNENFDNDELEAVVAYDYSGDWLAALTPDEFFGPLGGF